MHSLIHPHLAQATSPSSPPPGRHRGPRRDHPPPRPLRRRAAHALASAAARLDADGARRAIA